MLPGWGGMAVLDRSWYGRVLVERVEGFATEEQWRRAYREIVEFERTLADEGMIMVKFWMHLSSGEQLRRFQDRQRDPLRAWKLTAEDWRNREKRPQYEAAVEEMLARTDHADGAVGPGPGRGQAVGPGQGRRVGGPGHRAGLTARNLPVPPAPPGNLLTGPGARAACRCCGARAWSDGPRRGPGQPPGQPPRGAAGEGCCRYST